MRKVLLKELCSAIIDCPHSTPQWQDSGIPVVRNFNLNNNYINLDGGDVSYVDEETYKQRIRRAVPEAGDVVISREAPMGVVGLIPEGMKCCMGQRLVLLKVNRDKCSPQYLLHALASEYVQTQIRRIDTRGSIVSNIDLDTLRELEIPIVENQQEAASLLDSIDSKIETNGKIIAEMESLARTIYDYWFTQFDFPDENGNPYRSSGGTMVHNDTLHRDIPEDWKTGCLNDIAQIVSGATPPTSDPSNYCARGIAWITPDDLSNIGNRMYIQHGNRDISMQGLASCSASLIPAGSVVMSSRAPIGYIAISENEFCTNQGCKSFISRKEYGKWYIYYTLQRWMPLIESQGSGTTFKEISKEVLGKIPIAIPPTALIGQYSDTVEKLCEQRKSIETESVKLTSLRDWLLSLLMNGQAVIA